MTFLIAIALLAAAAMHRLYDARISGPGVKIWRFKFSATTAVVASLVIAAELLLAASGGLSIILVNALALVIMAVHKPEANENDGFKVLWFQFSKHQLHFLGVIVVGEILLELLFGPAIQLIVNGVALTIYSAKNGKPVASTEKATDITN